MNVKRNTLRTLVFLGIGLLALVPMWDASQVVLYFIGVAGLVALVSHLMRKVYFPYVDLEQFAKTALKDPLAAAIVFGSVVYLLATINTTISTLIVSASRMTGG